MIKVDKITLNNFKFFIDEKEHNTFELDGQNMLLYGENGSGKSSLYKAFEFLTQTDITEDSFNKSKNIFQHDDDTYLEFDFSNSEILRIDSDHLSLDNAYPFIEKLSISKPLLDYKSLLKIHYRTNQNSNEINIYTLFEKLLKHYPIGEDRKLKELRGQAYFSKLEEIIKNQLFDNINLFLEKFEQGFKIENISFDAFEREIILQIEYFSQNIEKYHIFLNEARLSALAISVYFSIIKKQFTLLSGNSLKILVLDDLLISLDMSNRLNLIDVIKREFSDFQIFFFTHDKGFFEILKDKMSWKAYEIYVDEHEEGFEKPYIKTNQTYHEKAIQYFKQREYEIASNFLRKEVEKQLYDYLGLKTLEGTLDTAKIKDNYKKLDNCFASLIIVLKGFGNCENIPDNIKVEKCIEFAQKVKEALISLENIFQENSFHDIYAIKDRILNPQSHYDNSKPLYKKELEDAIALVEAFDTILHKG